MTVLPPDDDGTGGPSAGGTGGHDLDPAVEPDEAVAEAPAPAGESPPSAEGWPVLREGPAGGQYRLRLDTDDALERESGPGRRSALRVALLIGLLGLATFVAIVVGRSLKPSSTTPATSSASRTSTAAVTPTTRSRRPSIAPKQPAAVRFGPLPARVVGRFRPAGGRASVALSGSTLVVAGGGHILAGPVGGHLSQVGSLPGARVAAAVFATGGAVYVLGGESGTTPTDQILRVDLASKSVVPAGTFEEPLAEAAVGARGGAVYLIGGWTGQKYATAILRYTPGSAPALVARLPQGLRSPAVAITGETLVVAGGLSEKGLSRQVYAVDLRSGGVRVLGALPRGLERAALLVVSSKLYLFGGVGAGGTPVASVVRIDPGSGKTTAVGAMPQSLADAAGVTVGAKPLLVDTRAGVVYRVG